MVTSLSSTFLLRMGRPSEVDGVVIENQNVEQIVYYWFDERGRRLTKESEIKVFALVDALMLDRSDGALVRLVAPVTGGERSAGRSTFARPGLGRKRRAPDVPSQDQFDRRA